MEEKIKFWLGVLKEENFNKSFIDLIENLIKGYKELEADNKKLKKENLILKNIDYDKVAKYFGTGSCILKSKVREKIKEYEKPIKFSEIDKYGEIIEGTMIYRDKIEALQELLEERN